MDELRIESESLLGLDSGLRRNDDGRADASRPMCRVPWASSALPTNCAGQGSRAAKQTRARARLPRLFDRRDSELARGRSITGPGPGGIMSSSGSAGRGRN